VQEIKDKLLLKWRSSRCSVAGNRRALLGWNELQRPWWLVNVDPRTSGHFFSAG
jgi:hypothetical protein